MNTETDKLVTAKEINTLDPTRPLETYEQAPYVEQGPDAIGEETEETVVRPETHEK